MGVVHRMACSPAPVVNLLGRYRWLRQFLIRDQSRILEGSTVPANYAKMLSYVNIAFFV